MSKKLKKGDRVILTGKKLIPYTDWPVWGSKYECVGTITNVINNLIHILWDNGSKKAVTSDYISHFTGREENSLSPNILFMLHKGKINEKN